MPTIIPVHFNHGHTREISEQEAKTLIGCFIILSVIWVLILIFLTIKYYQKDKNGYRESGYWTFWEWYFYGEYLTLCVFNWIMLFSYGIILLFWLGEFVGQFL